MPAKVAGIPHPQDKETRTMSQNLATVHPDAQQWAAVDSALEAIEQA